MRYEDGKIVTDYTKRASTDSSLDGIKTIENAIGKSSQNLISAMRKNEIEQYTEDK